MEVDGRPDIVVDLTAAGALDQLKTKPFTIKEGASFRMKARFKVQHEVLSGLKYLQVVKRKGIRVDKNEEMIVRFSCGHSAAGSPADAAPGLLSAQHL